MVVWGIVICVMLFSMSLKSGKGMWVVTIPGILIVAALATDFTGHMLHLPRQVFPYQKQSINAIHWALWIAAVPLVLLKLYDLWSKKRRKTVSVLPPSNQA